MPNYQDFTKMEMETDAMSGVSTEIKANHCLLSRPAIYCGGYLKREHSSVLKSRLASAYTLPSKWSLFFHLIVHYCVLRGYEIFNQEYSTRGE